MNWLERAQREINGIPRPSTAVTAERTPTAVMAVDDLTRPLANTSPSGRHLPPSSETEELRERFEERAAIMKFDGGLGRDEAECASWALVLQQCWRRPGPGTASGAGQQVQGRAPSPAAPLALCRSLPPTASPASSAGSCSAGPSSRSRTRLT